MNILKPCFTKVIYYSFFLSLVLLTSAWSTEPAQKSITISVSLDPVLQTSLNPEHTLFVYARAVKGPRMPLAIVRHKAGDLPLEVKLDSTMAMMPQMSLANFKQVVLLARISATGNAMPQTGDMIGETQPLEWQMLEQPVDIVINKQR
ncbi:MAG: hypothetical protein KZQ64_02885 [gamma proteobacterium symbiont of Bathyaustriella thionipta]|nr:hypothetical protein [gamma proteobacterium symbiont of Bathyaustriella thionipta]MCU7951328.1 hypothetical protein [gamma proteobacterium symbiont of Bathyaustriella thionipta]MCU7952332.1 hypothetical protein [gamma proteobacterium symbiont of Bathyaustriella thionipta]MCU7957881.1 hypothetical protein [gamma proteobacterium symbiont of Bathyaustriella thionipta]